MSFLPLKNDISWMTIRMRTATASGLGTTGSFFKVEGLPLSADTYTTYIPIINGIISVQLLQNILNKSKEQPCVSLSLTEPRRFFRYRRDGILRISVGVGSSTDVSEDVPWRLEPDT